ncbi:hypothetical protein [Acinetobacter towneri]|uniref:hypothetical protein n=1 Tax=Acinetobacter towneri TaxID=202956 RepID=UPI0034D39338
MATDVDAQYFSHLNGLTLGNNWGDLIRLLDKALVTGIDFTQITAASIDAQGDVHVTLYAAHNAMLFQVVELSGFAPASLNQKYRIKGVPSTTELILKPQTAIVETSITTVGTAKLASLGYEIIFRDANDVKRVYRAKNPTAQHPFIRVDESLTSPDGTTGVYTSTYAKYAMVGLLEHMEHIDDFENPDVLQLPFNSADPAKNWKITGTGTTVARGWHRWYWAKGWGNISDSSAPSASNRHFTLCGDKHAFYLLRAIDTNVQTFKTLVGCGLFNSGGYESVHPNWFLISRNLEINAGTAYFYNNTPDGSPLMRAEAFGGFYLTKNSVNKISNSVTGMPILPDYSSGFSNKFGAQNMGTITVPIYDVDQNLRGSLKHICYAGNKRTLTTTTPIISDSSMYVVDTAYTFTTTDQSGAFNFYLGELE